jgi:hypothetical protein
MRIAAPSFRKTADTVRLFLSSTFKDMQAERDHLITTVYPELEERLADLDLAFFDVDLRWGVPRSDGAETAEPVNTWEYCRNSIRETKPLFVGLLGHRYGSVAAPALLSEADRKWGEGRSITELEVRYAALEENPPQHSLLFCFRETRPPEDAKDAYRSYLDEEFADRLGALKAEIEAKFGVRRYRCKWNGERFDELEEFGSSILEDLWSLVLCDPTYVDPALLRRACWSRREFKRFIRLHHPIPRRVWEKVIEEAQGTRTRLDQEAREIERFCRERLQWFEGRDGELDLLEQFAVSPVEPDDPQIRVVHAVPGQGKTSLLAALLGRLVNRGEETIAVPHFVGATERSSTEYDMLSRLNDVIDEKRLRFARPLISRGENDLTTLRARLAHALRFYKGNRPLVMLVDGLNQLSDYGSLVWLPPALSKAVRLIVSCTESLGSKDSADPLTALRERGLPPKCFISLQPLASHDVNQIVRRYFKEHSKTLEAPLVVQIAALEPARNPLYLLVFLRELRSLSGPELETGTAVLVADAKKRFPETKDLFCWALKRVEAFGVNETAAWFNYLAIAREGLSPAQLNFVLAKRLGEPAGQASHRIRRSVRSYLQHRGRQIDFFHAAFRAAAEMAYPVVHRQQRHRELATALSALRSERRDDHASREMVYHFVEAADWDEVLKLLSDEHYLQERIHQRDGARRLAIDF